MMDDQMSSDSSSAEFAPTTGAQHRAVSRFVSLLSPDDPSGPPTQEDTSPRNDTLPSLQDRSWIGARMSPILNAPPDNDDSSVNHLQGTRMDQQHHTPLLQDDYFYTRLQAPSTSQQQLPNHHVAPDVNPFFVGHHVQQQQQQQHPYYSYAYPSAGHLRTEYPAFGIHPMQSNESIRRMHAEQQARRHQQQIYQSWGTLVCVVSGLTLLGMAVYDTVNGYYSMDDNPNYHGDKTSNWNGDIIFKSHAWSLPWGQPTLATGMVWGGLTPSVILTDTATSSTVTSTTTSTAHVILWPFFHILSSYGRLVTSAVQVHSVLEWCLVVLGWFVCQRPSRYRITTTTTATVYAISVLTGQLWMLAVWWIHGGSGSSHHDSTLLVAQCAAWGTCGVLCFVGMVRPQRRFGCFMICIGLVVLSLLQAMWILPAAASVAAVEGNSGNDGQNSDVDNSYYDYASPKEQRDAAFLPSNPLPLVVGCAVSSFVGWALYGSQMIGVNTGREQTPASVSLMKQYAKGTQKIEQFSMGMQLPTSLATQSPVSSGVRFFCALAVVMAWIIPLLVLAYFDYYYYYHGDGLVYSSRTQS